MKRWWLFILGSSLVVLIVAVYSPERIDSSKEEKTIAANFKEGSNPDKPKIASQKSETSIEKNSPPKEVKMDKALMKELNKFFSIFAEHYLEPFSRDKVDEKNLINFALNFLAFDDDVPDEWREWGNGKKWGLDDYEYCKISAKYVELIVKKFFDREVKKHGFLSEGGIKIKKGYYYVPWGCSNGHIRFSQVTKLVEIGNNEYVVSLNVFYGEGPPYPDLDLSPCEWEKFRWKKDEHGDEYSIPWLEERMIATIRKVGSGTKYRYILVEYIEDKKQVDNTVISLDPNGPKIVFLRKEKKLYEGECRYDEDDWRGLANAWVVGINGKNPIKITSSRRVKSPKWLNADTVALVSENNIWLIQIDENGKKKATRLDTPNEAYDLLWCSPDGEWIYFEEILKGDFVISKITKDGKGYQVLGEEINFGEISKDKTFFIHSNSARVPNWMVQEEIRSIDFNGRDEKVLYRAPIGNYIHGIAVSGDGQRIVFCESPEALGGENILVKEIDLQNLEITTINKIALGVYISLCFTFMPGEKAILYNDWPHLFILDLQNKDFPPRLFIENAFSADIWYPK